MQRPSTGLVHRRRTPEERQRRPQTSLGFARKSNFSGSSGHQLVGFDVRRYFRQNGSTAGLHVGVNGKPSEDAALQSYVENCRLEALVQELKQIQKEETEEEKESSWRKETGGGGGREPGVRQRTPLCWDSVLRETEVCVRIPHGQEINPRTKFHSTAVESRLKPRHSLTRNLQQTQCAENQSTSGVLVGPEGRCQCEEIEDEDTTDLREIAEKYPDLGLRVLDMEGRGKGEENCWRMRDGRTGTAKLAVSITMPSASAEERGRSVRKIYRPPPIAPSLSSPTNSGYISIVKRHLSPYLS